MSELDKIVAELEEQEKTLLFDAFGNDTALEIGMMLVNRAKADGLSITVDVTRGGQQLFHHALEGTSQDNDFWVRRKNATVYRFGQSSYRFALRWRSIDDTLRRSFGVSEADYGMCGGAFPVTVRGVGIVGTVTVSGLTEEDDHALVVRAIREYLAGQKSV